MKSFINILIFLFIVLPGLILVLCGGGFVLIGFGEIIKEFHNDPGGTLLIIGAPILGLLIMLGGFMLAKKINFKDKKSINNNH